MLWFFQPTLFCRHRKPKGDPHDFCVRCADQANWKNCDGVTQICIKCKDLDEEDWAERRKSDKKREYKREAARKRRSSGSVYSVTISEETMEDSQVLSQTLPASGTPVSTVSKAPQEEELSDKRGSILEKLEQHISDLSGNEEEESFDGVPPVRSSRRRSTESVSGTDSCPEQGDEQDQELPPTLSRQSPVEHDRSEDSDSLPLIDQARVVEFKDALAWVANKTVFTTGKPWTDAQACDQPIRMACQDILQPPRDHTKVALSPSPFLVQLAELRAAEVRKGTRAAEPKHIPPAGFSKKDMAAYVFTSPDIQPNPLNPPARMPRWLGECGPTSRLFPSQSQMQQLEQLTRQSISIISYVEALFGSVFMSLQDEDFDQRERKFQLKAAMLAGNAVSHLAERQINMLQQLVTHRRDGAVARIDKANGLSEKELVDLRHAPVLGASELFDPSLLESITEGIRERGRQSALDNMIYKQRQGKPKSQFSSPPPKKRSASATFTPAASSSSSPAPKRARQSTPAKASGQAQGKGGSTKSQAPQQSR